MFSSARGRQTIEHINAQIQRKIDRERERRIDRGKEESTNVGERVYCDLHVNVLK